MNDRKFPTYKEKTEKEGRPPLDRQNTHWKEDIVRKCKHEWQPVHMIMKHDGYMPDLANAKVYCVCMKCCGHTYIETAWVGYYIDSPDLLEKNEKP